MQSENVAWLQGIHHQVLQVTLEGLSHEDCLKRPEPGGNCINWILGHLLVSRQWMLSFFDCQWDIPTNAISVYQRGSSGDVESSFLPLDKLLSLWEESSSLLMTEIGKLTPEKMSAMVPVKAPFTKEDTLERRYFFLYFHESYHLGQIGLLRRLIGKDGAIR